MTPDEIIAANTRAGHTSWQNVARQLGRSVDSVRAQYDHGYERAYVWAPSRSPMAQAEPEDLIEPDDADIPTSSPYVRGPGLKFEILCLLQVRQASVEELAGRLAKTTLSIRKRLNDLKADGAVFCDNGIPRTWGLIEKDGTHRLYGASPLGAYRGTNTPDGSQRSAMIHLSTEMRGGQRFRRRRDD